MLEQLHIEEGRRGHLQDMRQVAGETSKSYLTRFNDELLEDLQ